MIITDTTYFPETLSNFTATITSVEKKRNSSEIIASTESSSENLKFNVVLFYYGADEYFTGDTIFIHKTIIRSSKRSSGVTLKYSMQGIHFIGSLDDNDLTLINKGVPGLRDRLRLKFNDHIDSVFSEETSSIVKALFTGNKSHVSKDVVIKFRDAGVLHLLSASGLHVGIAAGIPLLLLFFNFSRRKILFLSLILVVSYFYITEMPVSLLRASLMFSLFFLQIFLFRKSNALNILMLTGIFILLFAPWELFNTGFQLSFSATLGIILFYELYRRSLKMLPSYLKNSIAISLSAQIFTVPIIMFQLNQVNTISILSNIILVPLTTLFMYVTLAGLTLSGFTPLLADFSDELTFLFYKALIISADFFSCFKLNFFLDQNHIPVLLFMSIAVLPLLPLKALSELRIYPFLVSLLLCTLYLKSPAESRCHDIALISGESSLSYNTIKKEIIMDIMEEEKIEILLSKLRTMNFEINKVLLKNSSKPNLIACRKLSSDFIIDECCFLVLPDLTISFKNLIRVLNSDHIKISFSSM